MAMSPGKKDIISVRNMAFNLTMERALYSSHMRISNNFLSIVPIEIGGHGFLSWLLLQTKSDTIYKQENKSTKVESLILVTCVVSLL